jgi:hypothetical protein
MSLAQVTEMASAPAGGPIIPPIRSPADGANFAQTGRGTAGLSPIAVRAQTARVHQEAQPPASQKIGGQGMGATTQGVLEEWQASAERASRGERLVAGVQTADGETVGHRQGAGSAEAVRTLEGTQPTGSPQEELPESSAMGAAKGARRAD